MIREIFNSLRGRRKVLEDSLELEDAIQLVRNIEEERLKKIKFKMAFYVIMGCSFRKPTPKKVADFLKRRLIDGDFKIQEQGDFIRTNHEVFSSKYGKEAHYVDVTKGNLGSLLPSFVGTIKYVLSPKS